MSQAAKNNLQVVVAIVRDKEGRYLLVNRKDLKGEPSWIFPGGKRESGETLAGAASREVLEETGVECAVIRKIGQRVHPMTGRAITYLLCEYRSGEARVTEPDVIAAVRWMWPVEIVAHVKTGIFRPVLDILKEKPFPL
jgi:8-oxo-dGTP diphosphatase